MALPTIDSTVAPAVSVVMAVHNGERFVQEAVDSILQQSFQDFEFIIIDDGSTDNTAAILRVIADPRVRVYTNAENRGLTKCLNFGLWRARGKYVARMDHDDVSMPTRFEKQVAFLDARPDHALVGTWARTIDEMGQPGEVIEVPTSAEGVSAHLTRGNCFVHASVMMRRDAVLAVGGYDESIRYAQDYDLWFRLTERYQAANSGEPLLLYRVHSGQISTGRLVEQSICAQKIARAAMLRQFRAAGRGYVSSRCWWWRHALRGGQGSRGAMYLDLASRAVRAGDAGSVRRFARRAVLAAPVSRPAWDVLSQIAPSVRVARRVLSRGKRLILSLPGLRAEKLDKPAGLEKQ